ncbi:aspartate carbamoyltransferase catalytic subunit [Rubinisphaera margarita]|uniref:aspartate carbamoyltransferase catalytic subunit n=1 Tax=Rubinisphaera margarita TaxID=2909586 RepID=UPI001EE7DE91|nr:aspartate carbamoyltransferase catalytic subunit [Rubinisphaera margarita]MCG6156178.1 aspartate carbamoyltransferase catalytic subunit [Rubinisphaera margarita]
MVSFKDYFQSGPVRWTQRHLLGLEHLSADEITLILDQAAEFKRLANEGHTKLKLLNGVVVGNLFFEPSTRTRTSFGLAAKRLSADTVDFSPSGSSLSKGESFLDTARNIEAMGVSLMVVRHKTPGAPMFLSQRLDSAVLNAGDGTHEHPTQGLLDLMTMREQCGDLAGRTVALVGDIRHSRVARSNIWGLTKLGAHVIVCGPATLIPPRIEELGVEVSYSLDDVIPRVDCVNLLRIQFERQRGAFFPSIHEYAHLFGMNASRLSRAREDVVILAPGPINRGVEITPFVADGSHSVILDQVSNGLAVRMAALYLLHRRQQELSSSPAPVDMTLI